MALSARSATLSCIQTPLDLDTGPISLSCYSKLSSLSANRFCYSFRGLRTHGETRKTSNSSQNRYCNHTILRHVQKSRSWRQAGFSIRCSLTDTSTYKNVQVVDLKDILSEHGACGVGFIASLKGAESHQLIQDALVALGCMEHRGGCGADNDSGDGAGLMTKIPWELFNSWFKEKDLAPPDSCTTGVGMVFLSKDEIQQEAAKSGDHILWGFRIKSHMLYKPNAVYVCRGASNHVVISVDEKMANLFFRVIHPCSPIVKPPNMVYVDNQFIRL